MADLESVVRWAAAFRTSVVDFRLSGEMVEETPESHDAPEEDTASATAAEGLPRAQEAVTRAAQHGDRAELAAAVWSLFELRAALIFRQGLVTTSEARSASWRFVGEILNALPSWHLR